MPFIETQPGFYMRQRFKGDPIFCDVRQGWGFYDETWCEEMGFWPTCKEAEANMIDYCDWLISTFGPHRGVERINVAASS